MGRFRKKTELWRSRLVLLPSEHQNTSGLKKRGYCWIKEAAATQTHMVNLPPPCFTVAFSTVSLLLQGNNPKILNYFDISYKYIYLNITFKFELKIILVLHIFSRTQNG